MSASIAQTKHLNVSDGTDVPTVAITLDSAVSVGQFIDVFVTWGHVTGTAEAPTGCADNLGGGSPNVYTEQTACRLFDNPNDQESTRFTCPVTQAGTPTITVTFPGGRGYRGMTVSVVQDADSIDTGAINGQFQSASTAASSGSVTPDTAGSLLLSTTIGTAVGANTITLEGGSTSASNTGATDACASQWKIHPSTSATSATFTFGSSDSLHTSVITYRSSGGGGPPPVPVILPSSGLGGGMAMRKGGLR